MIVTPIKTRRLQPPKDDLFAVIKESVTEIPERSILVITSKIVSIHEGRCMRIEDIPDKLELIVEEADYHLVEPLIYDGKPIKRTIRHNTLISSAGIDESNANGHYILFPEDPKQSAKNIHTFIQEEFAVRDVGILITDSTVIPLRRGTQGISIGFYGFNPLHDYRDEVDLFGREFHFSQKNIADGLAAAAGVVMGEGNESTPLALVTDIPFVEFTTRNLVSNKQYASFEVSMEEDLFGPFFDAVPWKKGGGGKKIR